MAGRVRFEEIAPLIFRQTRDGPNVTVMFACPETGFKVPSRARLAASSAPGQLHNEVGWMVRREIAGEVGRMLGYGMLGQIGRQLTDQALRPATVTGRQQLFTEQDERDAIVEAFRLVQHHFVWRDGRFVAARAPAPATPRAAPQLSAAPAGWGDGMTLGGGQARWGDGMTLGGQPAAAAASGGAPTSWGGSAGGAATGGGQAAAGGASSWGGSAGGASSGGGQAASGGAPASWGGSTGGASSGGGRAASGGPTGGASSSGGSPSGGDRAPEAPGGAARAAAPREDVPARPWGAAPPPGRELGEVAPRPGSAPSAPYVQEGGATGTAAELCARILMVMASADGRIAPAEAALIEAVYDGPVSDAPPSPAELATVPPAGRGSLWCLSASMALADHDIGPAERVLLDRWADAWGLDRQRRTTLERASREYVAALTAREVWRHGEPDPAAAREARNTALRLGVTVARYAAIEADARAGVALEVPGG